MRFKRLLFICLMMSTAFCLHAKEIDKSKDPFLKIDTAGINSELMSGFQEIRMYYPTSTGDFFPGDRSAFNYLIAVQVLSTEKQVTAIENKIKTSLDWDWKQKYIQGQTYLVQVINAGVGFTPKECESFYNSHLTLFQEKTQRIIIDTTIADSTKRQKIVDTIYQKPYNQVKDEVIKRLFLSRYPAPDSLFKKQDPKDTAKIDSGMVKERWFFTVKKNAPEFFLKQRYLEKFKQKLPDSLSEWFGNGKVITPADFQVIVSWLPQAQRTMYSTPAGTAELARWLLKWKLFAEDAKKSGFADGAVIRNMGYWALKINAVSEYVNTLVVPKVKSEVVIDTAMCKFAFADERGMFQSDTSGFNAVVSRYVAKATSNRINSFIYDILKKHKVVLLKNDPVTGMNYNDELVRSPSVLTARADSLRDAGNSGEAESIYDQIVKVYPFTPEGDRAIPELAKIKTEKNESSAAVNLYRDYIILSNDKSKRCNMFFMIGFIYDEYLDKPELAEANYKWVLKNTPDCELVDDAEFMTIHLNEPMNSVEELRAEALRQGRKVDAAGNVGVPGKEKKK